VLPIPGPILSLNNSQSRACVGLAPKHRITLACFGASDDSKFRFQNLKTHLWQDILHDPYILLDIIVDELYLQVHGHVRSLRAVFGTIEAVSLLAL
jgi:hypothetical protein